MKSIILLSFFILGIVSCAKGAFFTTNWTFCANEGNTCTLSTTKLRIVAYGYGCENYFYKIKQGPDSISCTNAVFTDPKYGFVKHCSYTNADLKWKANEGGTVCNYYSTTVLVAYGKGTDYSKYAFAPLSDGNCFPCNNAQFGDPYPGVVKSCYISKLPKKCP